MSNAQQIYSQGLEFIAPDRYASIPLAAAPLTGTLPEYIDLSDDFPTPGHQGTQGSCVGWAIAYALKSFQERRQNLWALSDPSNLFSPAYVYNQLTRDPSCQGGIKLTDALDLVAERGALSLQQFPYSVASCTQHPTAAEVQYATQFRIASWSRVNVQSIVDLKAHVAAGFPVVVGLSITTDFHRWRSPDVLSQLIGTPTGGHAMVVVGYDDRLRALRLINSWGTGWGDNGFVWISYDLFKDMAREGYAVQDVLSGITPVVPEAAKESRSTSGGSEVMLKLTNQGYDPVDIYWIDYDGIYKHYFNLVPNAYATVQTFAKHVWAFRWPNGAESRYVAGSDGPSVEVLVRQ